MQPPDAFLFDLDGTLLDSRGDLADAANAARASEHLGPLTDEEVEAYTGWGLAALLRGVLPGADDGQLARARDVFVDHYRQHLCVRSRPCPGADAMFAALGGRPLGLVTNKPAMFTVPLLDELGWSGHFKAVVCGDTLALRKPSPEPLLLAVERLGLSPDRCVFVGDTPIDHETARNAGVPFVCVAWGREAAMAERVVSDLAELARWPFVSR